MRAAVALALSLTVATGACFPNNPRYQAYAKIGEGASVLAGIGLLLAVNTGADCDQMTGAGPGPDDSCKSRASALGDAGLALIVIGLVGFIATVSTAEDAKPTPTNVVPKADAPKPAESPAPAPAPAPVPAAPAPTEPATPPAAQDGAASPTP